MQRKVLTSINETLPAEIMLHCINQLDTIEDIAICACVCQQWHEQSKEAVTKHIAEMKIHYQQIINDLSQYINDSDLKKLINSLEQNDMNKLNAIISAHHQEIEVYYPSYEQNTIRLFNQSSISNLYLSQKSLEAATYNLGSVRNILKIRLPIASLSFEMIETNSNTILKIMSNSPLRHDQVSATQQPRLR